mgnify:CR=1 FL=1
MNGDKQKIDQQIFYKDEEDIITFSKIYDILLENYRILILSGFIGFIISVPYSLLLTKQYTATNIVLIPTEQGSSLSSLSSQFGGLASFAGVNLDSSSTNRKETLAVFRSRLFADKVLNELNLLPYFLKEDWDAEKNDWIDGKPKYDALELFQNISRLEEDKKNGIFSFTVVMEDPILAAKYSNEIIALFNNYMREKAIVEAKKEIAYLNAELSNTNVVSLQTVLYQLIEQKTQKAMLASVREDYAFKIIDPGIIPDKRSYPNRTQIVIVGSAATFVMGLFFVLVSSFYRTKTEVSEI